LEPTNHGEQSHPHHPRPFLSVRNGAKAVDFYKSAFGAEEIFRLEDPTGAVVSNLTINGHGFWAADDLPSTKTSALKPSTAAPSA
jgi:PhnB protein